MKGSTNRKSIERMISQKAIQMGNSYSCQMCVVGFMFGVCLTTLFMASLTSFATSQFSDISLSVFSPTFHDFHPNSTIFGEDLKYERPQVVKRMVLSESSINLTVDEKATSLYSIWSASLISSSIKGEKTSSEHTEDNRSNLPKAPHLENCKLNVQVNQHLDTRIGNGKFPRWTIWKGMLSNYPMQAKDQYQAVSQGAYPPWITGSDEENYPMTRKVQRDIWGHQHPINCSDSSVRFLVADWERGQELGIGAQIAAMSGLLAIAVNENRVLVTNYYNRADHDGCEGASRSSWSCYFFSETSQECRNRAFNLLKDKEAWEKGMITGNNNYNSKQIWAAKIPRVWGSPWRYLQPTTEVNGTLISHHRKMDRRWWRAQTVRFLMRFKTEYMCELLNVERHVAFGHEAATMVVSTHGMKSLVKGKSGIEEFVWLDHKPWVPQPLLSVHVRMGDKAREMKIVEFKEYMRLAERTRQQFPHLNSIWLSTEMQEVIERTRMYPHWKFYYSNVTRQVGSTKMATYEAGLGRETSTNYPLVNFLMAIEADFFVGALGSTWCFLIDGMRNTGGKVMAGYLSVNKDRFW